MSMTGRITGSPVDSSAGEPQSLGVDVRVRVRVGFLGPMAVLPRPGLLASVAIPGVRGVR